MTIKMTKEEILAAMKGKKSQAMIEREKENATLDRESNLMLLGYNQALLDQGESAMPEGWTVADMQKVIAGQRTKLGI